MSLIVPAVIPESKEQLLRSLSLFHTFTDEIQIDIVDGVFVPAKSWPLTESDAEGNLEEMLDGIALPGMKIELDLMIKDPERVLTEWLTIVPTRVVVHVESTNNLPEIFAHKMMHGYVLGLSCNNDTDISVLDTFPRGSFDYVQLMGIKDIGVQGQPFDERVLTRIKEIKAAHPSLEVSIDGSVNETTLPLLKEAGADRFVVGSAILSAESPEAMYNNLVALAK